ncbi:TPA: hypothetical protein HA244_03070 [Candidatus Micrarchaeota archaeon]|nr:hypothetical protein [Candidatus Micrarchaeota archaeon]
MVLNMAGEDILALAVVLILGVNAFLYYRLKDLREQHGEHHSDKRVKHVKEYVSNFSWYDENEGTTGQSQAKAGTRSEGKFSQAVRNSLSELRTAHENLNDIHNRIYQSKTALAGEETAIIPNIPGEPTGPENPEGDGGNAPIKFFPQDA